MQDLEGSIPLIIDNKILNKIKFLCNKINKVEWSGVLFYKVVGTIKNTDKVKLIVQDILLMDKGTQAYTSYDFNEDVVMYRMDTPGADDWSVGLIHSHNTMGVFFSPTDVSELRDNVGNHNIYLSLIVNNFMEMTAKVAFIGENTENKYVCKDEKGKDYTLGVVTKKERTMFVYDCNVQYKKEQFNIEESFVNRLTTIINKPKPVAPVVTLPVVPVGNPMLLKQSDFEWASKNEAGTYKPAANSGGQRYNFAAYVARLGNKIADDSLSKALLDIKTSKINIDNLCYVIYENYEVYFEDFFANAKHINQSNFIPILDSLIGQFRAQNTGIIDTTFFVKSLIDVKEYHLKTKNVTTNLSETD